MRKIWIAGLLLAAGVPVAGAFTPIGQLAFSGARAWLASKADFTQCTADPRIWCEPGAEALGAKVAPMLPAAVQRNVDAYGLPFAGAIRVNVYASDDSFSLYSAVPARAAAAVTLGEAHVSAKMKDWAPERAAGVLAHELAHLHLIQRIGAGGIANVPNWFWEGLPTYFSRGGGAGQVTRGEAVSAFVKGAHLTPEDHGSLLSPKYAESYQLTPGMYYRQASVLIGWMDQKDPAAFKRLIAALGRGERFGPATASAYGRTMAELWTEFQQAMRQELEQKSAAETG